MLTITQGRVGALTEVTATLSDEGLLLAVQAAFQAATSRFTPRDGLMQSVRCKGAEASRLLVALASIKAPAAVQAAPDARGWTVRRMVLSSARRSAMQIIVGADQTELSLTGFGQEFIGQEQDGCLWGETACYAYYA